MIEESINSKKREIPLMDNLTLDRRDKKVRDEISFDANRFDAGSDPVYSVDNRPIQLRRIVIHLRREIPRRQDLDRCQVRGGDAEGVIGKRRD